MWHHPKVWAGSLLVLACLTGGHAEIKTGDKFPTLDASVLTGGTPPVTTGQVVLVDFWASWCAPCKESFPFYAKLHADYRARGLVIVAVSVDTDQSAYAAFVKKMAPPFAVLRDKAQELVRQVAVPTMPTCFLLGRDGQVRFVHAAFHGAATDQLIRQEIDSLLAENPPST